MEWDDEHRDRVAEGKLGVLSKKKIKEIGFEID
jgi:hypothetical protein